MQKRDYPSYTGKRFERLLILGMSHQGTCGAFFAKTLCDCGTKKSIRYGDMIKGSTKSCGCLQKEKPSRLSHNETGTRLYSIWHLMKGRCSCKSYSHYESYGGRGIKVCAEWMDYEPFRDWALRAGYEKNLTIDRINNDGNYEPGNCRWVDWYCQANNTRKNIYIEHEGKVMTPAQWAREKGLHPQTVYSRIQKGLSVDELFLPPDPAKSKQRRNAA